MRHQVYACILTLGLLATGSALGQSYLTRPVAARHRLTRL